MSSSNIPSRWKKLSGEDNWNNLLHPLDLDLRRYIIHYGQRVGAVGDLFNQSTEFGKRLPSKEAFFSRACLEKGNKFKYKVTDYFYAGSATVESAWFGYVAVTTDEGKASLGRRDILVVWRGTITNSEWFNNANKILTPASELFGTGNNAQVHSGFLSLYTGTKSNSANNMTSARQQVQNAVRKLVNEYQNEEISITVTGFSLGAALATLNAMDIVHNGYNKPTGNSNKSFMVTAFVYGGPRVGNTGLDEFFKKLNHHLHLLRITNQRDPVPGVPRSGLLPFKKYTHLGIELQIMTNKSKYLNWRFFGRALILPDESSEEEITGRGILGESDEYFSAHNMDVYVHGVAIKDDGSDLAVEHDIALVNKYLDRLKDEYKIPPNWWDDSNHKNMVQEENGRWKVKK